MPPVALHLGIPESAPFAAGQHRLRPDFTRLALWARPDGAIEAAFAAPEGDYTAALAAFTDAFSYAERHSSVLQGQANYLGLDFEPGSDSAGLSTGVWPGLPTVPAGQLRDLAVAVLDGLSAAATTA